MFFNSLNLFFSIPFFHLYSLPSIFFLSSLCFFFTILSVILSSFYNILQFSSPSSITYILLYFQLLSCMYLYHFLSEVSLQFFNSQIRIRSKKKKSWHTLINNKFEHNEVEILQEMLKTFTPYIKKKKAKPFTFAICKVFTGTFLTIPSSTLIF